MSIPKESFFLPADSNDMNINSNSNILYNDKPSSTNKVVKVAELGRAEGVKSSKENSNEVLAEIIKLENIIQTEFNNSALKKKIGKSTQEEDSLIKDNKQVLLKNLQNQIVQLELAQYAESVTTIETSKKNKSIIRVSCDPSDRLPSITFSHSDYLYLFKFRDSSNFLFSLDKSHSQSHIFINEKRKDSSKSSKAKEECQKRSILRKEDINIDFKLCHNCKIKKPTELMVQCKSKDNIRSTRTFQVFNLNLIRKLEKYFIYPGYSGDVRDLISSINVKAVPEKYNDPCGKYFCNYCLKGSYQLNVENAKPEINLAVSSNSQASTCNNSETDKDAPQLARYDSTKSKSIKSKIVFSKDWCCPWCSNDCFCSRCLREEQIFKLLSIYFYYEGDMAELLFNILQENPILRSIKEHLIINNLELRDLAFFERQCKNSKGSSQSSQSNLPLKENSSNTSSICKHLKLGKNLKIIKKTKDQKDLNSKVQGNKLFDSKNGEKASQYNQLIKQYEDIIKKCDLYKDDLLSIQKNIAERIIVSDSEILLNQIDASKSIKNSKYNHMNAVKGSSNRKVNSNIKNLRDVNTDSNSPNKAHKANKESERNKESNYFLNNKRQRLNYHKD
eukprot:CAMPEP_0170520382 /NCGR_PEP_ID=MMETSP0209-20121228/5665_1 /TAXON_ID=665100 ORGANISM="Litonotus pictus, Strain P1" /NCGR_SAMPLE_ID=MMETSP0209 /ASSEMBLY_ACC=CAM_ASM_000301 /LENGTH=616 /DNA_ID=CAMNT_0010806651 /DNA_START=253 /DNA_END=2103 /DNA_ORIENTATION=-